MAAQAVEAVRVLDGAHQLEHPPAQRVTDAQGGQRDTHARGAGLPRTHSCISFATRTHYMYMYMHMYMHMYTCTARSHIHQHHQLESNPGARDFYGSCWAIPSQEFHLHFVSLQSSRW